MTRLNNSVNGNPRWRVTLATQVPAETDADLTTHITQSDGSIGYSLQNAEYRDTNVMVSFSRAGRIADVKRADAA